MTALRRLTRWDHFKQAVGWPGVLSAATYSGPISLQSDESVLRFIGGNKSATGVAITEHTAVNLPAVWACINRISNPLAGVPIRVMKPAGNRQVEVTDHPLVDLLRIRPNERMSSRALRKFAMGQALLWGNGLIEIERKASGEVIGLWPWLTCDSEIAVSKDRSRLQFLTRIDGREERRELDQVIHLMDISADAHWGMSPIQRAAEAFGLAIATQTFGAKFFANDAKSGGFLMHPAKLGPTATKNIEESFRSEAGLKNAGKVRVLEEGMKFIDTQIPPEAAQFLGTRQFQLAEIARIYDVPLILLQSTENTTAWGTGIEQLMIGFIRNTVKPWCDAWEQEMNWKLFTQAERKQGLVVRFNLNGLLRGDTAARAQFYTALFNMGAASPNWILSKEDEDIDLGEDGDKTFIPSSMQTLENAAAAPPAPPPGSMPPGAGAPGEDPAAPPKKLVPVKKAADWVHPNAPRRKPS